jgi:general secretion pathway protein A
MELVARIEKMPSFQDRIAFRYLLRPLTEGETREMIHFRLKVAGYDSKAPLFANEAISRIHSVTRGYPRKTIMLCHDALELAVIRGRKQVDRVILDELLESPFLRDVPGHAPAGRPGRKRAAPARRHPHTP